MFRFTCNSLIGYGTSIVEHLRLSSSTSSLVPFAPHYQTYYQLEAAILARAMSEKMLLNHNYGLYVSSMCKLVRCSRWDVFNCSSLAKTQAMLGNTTVGLRCGLFFDVSLVCQGLYCIRTGRSDSEFRHRVRQHWHSHFTEHPDSRFSFLDSWIVTPCVWMMQLVKN